MSGERGAVRGVALALAGLAAWACGRAGWWWPANQLHEFLNADVGRAVDAEERRRQPWA